MAHVLLERMLRERQAEGQVRVRSGGVAAHARDGMIASLDARLVLREVGIHLAEDAFQSTDLRRHREVVAEADLVLTMTEAQKPLVAALGVASGRPLFTLREFAGEPGDIDDPYGGDDHGYRHARDVIRRCLERSFERILDGKAPTAASG
jgi:protein-tyrosine-phosphatase